MSESCPCSCDGCMHECTGFRTKPNEYDRGIWYEEQETIVDGYRVLYRGHSQRPEHFRYCSVQIDEMWWTFEVLARDEEELKAGIRSYARDLIERIKHE